MSAMSTEASQPKGWTRSVRTFLAVTATVLVLGACGDSSVAPHPALELQLPTTQFAVLLGLATPVTKEEAQMIAVEATGGTVIDVAEETENGELMYEVRVQTQNGRLEVEVRASDGAITEIEPDDG